MWTPNPSAAAYNVYRDGELACTVPAGDDSLHPDAGLPFYLDDGTCGDETGWGLGYDTEYTYNVSAVSSMGTEGASSDPVTATTLPQVQAFLQVDVSLANADVAASASPFGAILFNGCVAEAMATGMDPLNKIAPNGEADAATSAFAKLTSTCKNA
jgi:hypothetical protein